MPLSIHKRTEVFTRDNYTCQYCKRTKDTPGIILNVDHIIPDSRGGSDELDNLETVCERCNHFKHNSTKEEFQNRANSYTIYRITREALYMAQWELADKTGLSTQTIIKVEQGKNVSPSTLKLVRKALGLETENQLGAA